MFLGGPLERALRFWCPLIAGAGLGHDWRSVRWKGLQLVVPLFQNPHFDTDLSILNSSFAHEHSTNALLYAGDEDDVLSILGQVWMN